MQEVEKEELVEEPGKRPKKRKVTVMEYVYEAELEGTPPDFGVQGLAILATSKWFWRLGCSFAFPLWTWK